MTSSASTAHLEPPGTPRPALLEALSGRRPARTPVWFMRQAGRSLPEYRALRRRVDLPMLEVCLTPELAAEATLQPVRRHGVDAAILFSDIMVPLRLAGVGVEIAADVGPVLDAPVRTAADVARLEEHRMGEGTWTDAAGRVHDAADGVAAVERAVDLVLAELGAPGRPGRLTGTDLPTGPHPDEATGVSRTGRGQRAAVPWAGRGEVPGQPGRWTSSDRERAEAGLAESRGAARWTPLIGFGGAPFTLAAYLVEGRPSRDHLAARTLMHADPATWDRLMTWCATLTGDFIATQVRAGASAAQLFDSWAGSLSPTLYRARVAPYSALALERARTAVSGATGERPAVIHFGTGTARLLTTMRAVGADAVGVDDRTELAWAIEQLGGATPAPAGRPSATPDPTGTGRPGAAPTCDAPAEATTGSAGGQAGTCPVQGNLDPALLGAPWEVLARAVDVCVEEGRAAPGHVVNLGHGVPPGTDPDALTLVVARVHQSPAWDRVARAGWSGATASGADGTDGTDGTDGATSEGRKKL